MDHDVDRKIMADTEVRSACQGCIPRLTEQEWLHLMRYQNVVHEVRLQASSDVECRTGVLGVSEYELSVLERLAAGRLVPVVTDTLNKMLQRFVELKFVESEPGFVVLDLGHSVLQSLKQRGLRPYPLYYMDEVPGSEVDSHLQFEALFLQNCDAWASMER